MNPTRVSASKMTHRPSALKSIWSANRMVAIVLASIAGVVG
ncbi:MAG: hypothetical protein NTZ61_09325 [Proteobacteria bacterium]|nr:hypothetical protein [Pseudomonadota bacterium]